MGNQQGREEWAGPPQSVRVPAGDGKGGMALWESLLYPQPEVLRPSLLIRSNPQEESLVGEGEGRHRGQNDTEG